MYDEFLKYGRISTIRIDGEGEKKVCYITFKHSDQAQAAIEYVHDKLFLQQTVLRVEKFDMHSQSASNSLNNNNNNNVNNYTTGTASSNSGNSTVGLGGHNNTNNSSNSAAQSAGSVNKTMDEDLDEFSLRATRTLYIGNLDRDVKHCDLREKLDKKYGDIIEIEIKKDNKKQQSNTSNSYAFIQFSDIKSVIKAMRCMNGK